MSARKGSYNLREDDDDHESKKVTGVKLENASNEDKSVRIRFVRGNWLL